MNMPTPKILVWLPSPMGDAVLCTPALRALREYFNDTNITFLANPVVKNILSPNSFCDDWLEQKGDNPFTTTKILRPQKFTHAVLFKNSFASAFACFLAQIPIRTGYSRQGRGIFLTEKLHPAKIGGKFKPGSMLDYYLAIASWLGADTENREMSLDIDSPDENSLLQKIPLLKNSQQPLVIFVPGGAFGPSKCWLPQRFARLADCLIDKYNAKIIISVGPQEKHIADAICEKTKNQLINLGDSPISLGQLKALISRAALVITNDTGPRHIALALKRKVVTLFGPNDPAWTDTGSADEIKIVAIVPCAPCARPNCKKEEHYCMNWITVDMVFSAAEKLLG